MSANLEKAIAEYNTGKPIPAVHPADLRSVVQLLTELQTAHLPLGFSLDLLASRCSSESPDTFALSIRGVLLVSIRQLPNCDIMAESLIDRLAILPLVVADLTDPKAMLLRLRS
jgi:hypothetical protein